MSKTNMLTLVLWVRVRCSPVQYAVNTHQSSYCVWVKFDLFVLKYHPVFLLLLFLYLNNKPNPNLNQLMLHFLHFALERLKKYHPSNMLLQHME